MRVKEKKEKEKEREREIHYFISIKFRLLIYIISFPLIIKLHYLSLIDLFQFNEIISRVNDEFQFLKQIS